MLTSQDVTPKLRQFLNDDFVKNTHLIIDDLVYMFNHTSYESMSYSTRIGWATGAHIYLLPEFRRHSPAQAFHEVKKIF